MSKNDKLLRTTYAMAYAMVFRPHQFTEVSLMRLLLYVGMLLKASLIMILQNEDARSMLREVFQLWVAIRMESR
jgi:hypothetical protein